ncbi:MAG: GDSL-type esterase/lipase family protein [Lentisphaeraceae bacterium]|nr:GDSL-type esterase/lipase family protein [Lentisphaeraceae bacterium]
MKVKLLIGFVVFIALFFTFCSGDSINSWEIDKPKKVDQLVFFGDSLTAGYGLKKVNESFPNVVSNQFNKPFTRLGFSGYTTGDAIVKLKEIPQKENTLVVVTLGGNDILKNRPLVETEKNLRTLFQEIKAAGHSVLYTEVLGLFGGKRHQMHVKVCTEMKVPMVIDIMAGVFSNGSLMQGDSVHPAASGCKVIGEKITATIKDLNLIPE